MASSSKPTGYSSMQIMLHWTIAVLILIQFLASGGIENSWNAYTRGTPIEEGATRFAYLHVAFGLTIFVLAILRLWIRFTRGAPPLDGGEPAPVRFLAHATHVLLYVLIIGMPISGSVAWFLGIEGAGAAHVLATNVLFWLVVLHIIGALVHSFVFKPNVLARMAIPDEQR